MHSETLDPKNQKVHALFKSGKAPLILLQRGDFKESSSNSRAEVPARLTLVNRAMNFGEFTNGKAQQPLPTSLALHEAELNHFGVLCHELCIKLLRLFAHGLRVWECVRLLAFLPFSRLIRPRSIGTKVGRIGSRPGMIFLRALPAACFACVSTLFSPPFFSYPSCFRVLRHFSRGSLLLK